MTLATVAIVAGIAKWCTPHPQKTAGTIAAPAPTKTGNGLAAPIVDANANGSMRMIHGDARHTHRSNAIGPSTAKLSWKLALGSAIEAQVVASPDESVLYAASLDGKLHAIDRASGKEKWSLDLGERAYATPFVSEDGTIYAGSDAKKLVAIAPDGKTKWKLETDGEIDTGIVPGPEGTIVCTSGSDVLAVKKGGDIAWRFSAKKKIFTSPAVSDTGLVVFGSQDDRLYGVKRGEKMFAIDLGADVDGSPAIGDDGAIYAGTDAGEIVRVRENGEIAWRANVGGFVRGVLSIARNGDVLAGVYGPSPRQVRVSADGTIRGALGIQGTGAREFGVHGGALEDGAGKLYFGAQDDLVYSIGTQGEVLFRFPTEGDVDAPITMLSDGSVVVAADDGTVYYLAP